MIRSVVILTARLVDLVDRITDWLHDRSLEKKAVREAEERQARKRRQYLARQRRRLTEMSDADRDRLRDKYRDQDNG